ENRIDQVVKQLSEFRRLHLVGDRLGAGARLLDELFSLLEHGGPLKTAADVFQGTGAIGRSTLAEGFRVAVEQGEQFLTLGGAIPFEGQGEQQRRAGGQCVL